jgi:hypothetical protein
MLIKNLSVERLLPFYLNGLQLKVTKITHSDKQLDRELMWF